MKVLITGGAGFIGSHLLALLVKNEVDVCVFDSLISGKLERIPSGVQFIKGDIRDLEGLKIAMRGVTHVVHLAALISVSESMTDPLTTHEVNVIGTENILHAMHLVGIRHIVYASSAAIYGDDPSLPKVESSPLRPQSPYALSKVINEMQVDMYGRIFGFSTTVLRFFNVYGPGQAGNHPYASVIPRWIEAIKKGDTVTVYGDGSQTRDFVHILDVATAIYRALTTDINGIFNIASGEEVSLNALIQIISNIYPKTFVIKREPVRAGDILRSMADISAARGVLGFATSVVFNEGLKELFTT